MKYSLLEVVLPQIALDVFAELLLYSSVERVIKRPSLTK